MTSQLPITPPPELIEKWWLQGTDASGSITGLATQAARWGADQELKACYEWVVRDWTDIQSADMLLAARRPKPPSLKEQALRALKDAAEMADYIPPEGICTDHIDTILRALEQLDD